MRKKELYSNTALLYDFDNRDMLNYDIEFCKNFVEKTEGNILEIACGTGRITIPLYQHTERNIYALDLSQDMLNVFRQKIEKIDCDYKRRLKIDYQNMIDFSYSVNFGLVILIWRSFQFITNGADAFKCLKNIWNHMDDNALFLFSVFEPQNTYGDEWMGKECITYDIVEPESKTRIVRYTKNIFADEENQIIKYLTCYDLSKLDGEKMHFEDTIILKYYYNHQIVDLINLCGFEIVKTLDKYDDRLSEKTDQIFVLKKNKYQGCKEGTV